MAGFLPSTDAGLLAWSLQFKTLIVASPTEFGLTLEQATAYDALHQAYATALAAADPAVRNKPATANKNTKKAELKDGARRTAKIIEGQPFVTDAQKLELGLNVRKDPTPVPPPSFAPDVDILSVTGRKVKIRLHNAQTVGHRRKPAGVLGATIFTHVGDAPPQEIDDWKFEGSTTQTVVTIDFPVSAEPGTKVWITAFWYSRRAESGPACTPISTLIQYGAPQLKLAGTAKKAA